MDALTGQKSGCADRTGILGSLQKKCFVKEGIEIVLKSPSLGSSSREKGLLVLLMPLLLAAAGFDRMSLTWPKRLHLNVRGALQRVDLVHLSGSGLGLQQFLLRDCRSELACCLAS